MMHPHTTVRPVDDTVGLGVFATQPILRGTLVWVRDDLDQGFSPQRFRTMEPTRRVPFERATWGELDGSRVLRWDHGRYVNHSCEANCLGVGADSDVAVRDIGVGEQLTLDYRSRGDFLPFTCACGAPSCVGQVDSDAGDDLRWHWNRQLAEAILRFDQVSQPLTGVLPGGPRRSANSAPLVKRFRL